MKILVLSNLYPPDAIGGYEMGCRQVVEALRAQGHEVLVVTSTPRTPVPSEPHVRRVLKLTDIWDHYSQQRSAPATLHLAECASHRINAHNVHHLLAVLDEFRPDVVYVWMIVGLGGLGLMAALHLLKVPWVWHLMDDVPSILCRASGRLVPALASAFERLLRGTFLVCSQQVVEEIEADGLRLPGEVQIVPNWVEGPPPARSRFYQPGQTLRIVSAAGLIERQVDKGIDLIIEAAARLRDWGQDRFAVDLYGTVADAYFPALVHKHGLDDCVTFHGRRTQADLLRVYDEADLFAFPTHDREPFGFAPLEASGRGCVPLLAHICGISEWFVDGVHCLKARRTAAAFARVIAQVLDGKVSLEPIARRGAAVVRRDFHLDAILPRINHALERAALQPRAGAESPSKVYRMAVLAEKVSHVTIHESLCA
jgi:glycogen(starch) synthase